ncbi:amino acid adenylation domain-containing protein [Pseudomonas sp. NPDC090755]|uniref:amino acid adenylation domain-containing protein n=1 Tax=Pseudomonas sp. NPDC090755 TaxID=3364481 RepID=UPI00383BC2B6
MNAEKSLKLARRFLELPLEKRKVFLDTLSAEGLDFSQFPIASAVDAPGREELSYAQQRMWFLWRLDPRGSSYNIPSAARLLGPLQPAAVDAAIASLVERHATLRCVFEQDEDGRVLCKPAAQLPQVSHEDCGERLLDDAALAREVEAESARPFDLEKGPLLRVRLLRLADEHHVLLLTVHHIVADGWSMGVMLEAFSRCYEAHCQGRAADLPALSIEYADYGLWQRRWLEAGEQARQLAYWQAQLGDEHPLLELPLDHPRSAVQDRRAGRLEWMLEPPLVQRLNALATRHGLTLSMVLLAGFQLLLQRYSQLRDIRVGMPIANRNRVETEGLIGFFVNTLVVRSQIEPQMSVADLLAQVREAALGAQAHQELPFERLVEALQVERRAGVNPLFQVLYNHQAEGGQLQALKMATGLEICPLSWRSRTSPFDLGLDTYERGGQVHAAFNYCQALFEPASIAHLRRHWENLLQALCAGDDTRLDALPMLGAQEHAACLADTRPAPQAFAGATVLDLLRQRVDTPDPAVICAGEALGDEQLQRQANRLAQRLLASGCGPETRVGIAVERSAQMIVGLLAVLKAGAAYVPLDPELPRERLQYMIEDSGIGHLLTQSHLLAQLPGCESLEVLLLDQDHADWPDSEPQVRVLPEHLAYVIYTSGSTGRPKGVMISHGALANYVQGVAQVLPLEQVRSLAIVSTLSADLGHTTLFTALCAGRTLHVIDRDTALDAECFAAYMSEHAVDVLKIVPSHMDALLGEHADPRAMPRHTLVLGGEACSATLLQRLREVAGDCRIFNHYGPTETTVGVLTHDARLTAEGQRLALGRPLANVALSVLDDALMPVPASVPGELYLGGAGVARGYLDRPGLTAERFVPDPYGAPGSRAYRSADLVRRDAEGVIDYVGRSDHQVKIRGFRVELGEIAASLQAQPQVREAVVRVAGSGASAQLVAWLVLDGDQPATTALAALRQQLALSLPEYMIPAQLLSLPALPLTLNGKLDVQALPQPTALAGGAFQAPHTELQIRLADVWRDVLKVERVGLDDNFFALGGHSLLATRVIARLRSRLALEVPLRSLFESESFGQWCVAVEQLAPGSGRQQIQALDRAADLPASHAQYRQWLFWTLNPHNPAYNTPIVVRLRGDLNLAAVQGAFDALVARHEPLRTTFRLEGDTLLQVIHPAARVALEIESLRHANGWADEGLVRQRAIEETQRLFDLDNGPLLRVKLLHCAEDEHVLVLTLHHIVCDGWSMDVMAREFVSHYQALCQGRVAEQAPLAVHYADYAQWQRQWLAEGEMQRQLDYWTAQLGGEQALLELPLDHPRVPGAVLREGRLDLRLPDDLETQLRRFLAEHNMTQFQLFLGVFGLLLQRYSGQSDLRIGVPVSNRNCEEVEGLIGFFVNTLVLRLQIDPRMPALEHLSQVRDRVLAAQAHQDLPFDKLVEALNPQRLADHNPLFQVMYNHLSSREGEVGGNSLEGVVAQELPLEGITAQFDLTLETLETRDGIQVSMLYAADLFERKRIEQMLGHWLNLLQALISAPATHVAELPMLDAREQQALCAQASRPATTASVIDLFESRAAMMPIEVALILGEQTLSYGELRQRVEHLAAHLQGLGAGPETLVGICAPRGFELMVALLAVHKAGAAYVPLDPAYPAERLQHMVNDSGLAVLLCDNPAPWMQALPTVRLSPLCAPENAVFRPVAVQPQNLAYVIYTSGSTGLPKGVAVSQGALAMHCQAAAALYGVGAGDGVLQFASASFDAAAEQIFMALISGARLLLGEVAQWSGDELADQLQRHRIDLVDLPPAYLGQFDQALGASGRQVAVRTCVLGGEAWDEQLIQGLRHVRFERLFNAYGPTEAVISPLIEHYRAGTGQGGKPAIGRAVGQRSAWLVDDELNRVPEGVRGQLLIGGLGLARGYLQQPGLTAERFVPDPFGAAGARLYRTGDAGRYLDDGRVVFAGRVDEQLKIRGFRIEPGEIEAALLALPGVREAAVLAQPGPSGARLVGYVAGIELDPSELQALLRERLPEHMVPRRILLLAQLPLTLNGKLDRNALPPVDEQDVVPQYQAPGNDLERDIAELWAQVLRVPQVGVTENFFELGGDSIISIQVVSRARQLGIQFSPADLFKHQTVRELARIARRGERTAGIDQGPVSGEQVLQPAQQRFFAEAIPERHHWNQTILLNATSSLDAQWLEQALQTLVEHHDSLRSRFSQGASGWQAQIADLQAPRHTLLWRASVAEGESVQALCEHAQRSLDLEHGPLLRGLLIDGADGSQRVLLTVHHLVIDGVSWRVLLEDLQSVYSQLCAGQPAQLPARTTSTQRWARRLAEQARSPAWADTAAQWQALLAGVDGSLPVANPQVPCLSRDACSIKVQLDGERTRQLLQQAPAAYRTQVNDLLLTALARVVADWTGRPEVLLELEGHGREGMFDDLDPSRTLGWFTSLFPVRLSVAAGRVDSLKQIKEQLRAIPHRGLSFGVLRYLGEEAVQHALAALPVPRITFNYLGQFDGSFQADEGALFVPCNDAFGPTMSEQAPLGNWLSIDGQVYGGQLTLNWTFSTAMFEPAFIESLSAAYIDELQALIGDCLDSRAGGVTPSDFPLAGLTQVELDRLPVAARDIEDLYPLSPLQQGLLFHARYGQTQGDYINQTCVDIKGLDVERFEQAWQSALQAHPILRSGFIWQGEMRQPLQLVQRDVPLHITRHDWRGRPGVAQALATLEQQERERPFELSQAPLLRLVLVQVAEDSYRLIYTNHHILLDGWSNARLIGEVLARYRGQAIASAPGSYRDYIQWLQARDVQGDRQFWQGQLARLPAPTRLSQALQGLARDSGTQAYGHGDLRSHLDEQATARLVLAARQAKVTVNTLVQAAWLVLLQRCTDQPAVALGATVAGRPGDLPGIEEQVGLFINTLPLIAEPRPQQALGAWLSELQALNLTLREHEHTPLYEIQSWAGQGGDALFDSILVFENYPLAEALQGSATSDLQFGLPVNHEQTHYPLTLAVALDGRLSIHYSYLREAFDDQQVACLSQYLLGLLQQIAEASLALPVGELQLLDGTQQAERLHAGSDCPGQYPGNRSLPGMIAAHARQRPQATALIAGERHVSFAELEQASNRLARYLSGLGVGRGVKVGVALARGVEVPIALLAIIKTGAAYVPMDASYPAERLAYMVEDSGMTLLLSQRELASQLSCPARVQVLLLDELAATLQALPDQAPAVTVEEQDLAYVIYTSGSTGQPKGVCVSHGPLSMHCQAIAERYEMREDDCELHFLSFAFDGAHERWLTALTSGASLLIRDDSLWTPSQTLEAMKRHGVSVAAFPPLYLHQLAECALQQGRPQRLRVLCFGGDAVPRASFDLVRRALDPQYMINGYGPTETVVTPLIWKAGREDNCPTAYAPIGKRIGQRSGYVLDACLNPVAKGMPGELYLGGEGVALGYLQRPGLTADRFVCDPFDPQGGRLYRSGDLVRELPCGNLEYLGRLDNQVKIRGFRVETGEIEARLQQLPDVAEAAVIASAGAQGQQLHAYLVAVDAALPADEQAARQARQQVRQALGKTLPDYMVPASFTWLGQLPLSPNGKLDRKALPLPEPVASGRPYVAPQSELEQQIAQIWQDVLQLEQVGLDDHFFELGGHSLLATQVTARVETELGVSVPLDLLFKAESLKDYVASTVPYLSLGCESDLNELHDFLSELETI